MITVAEHISQLQSQHDEFSHDMEENHSYYESEHRPQALGLAVPPAMRHLLAKIGWAALYLDSLEERLDIEGFRMGKSSDADDRLWKWWQANNLDTGSGQAHLEALIYGRAYITVSAPDKTNKMAPSDCPVIRVESPATIHAEIDESTQRVTRAIRFLPSEDGRERITLYLPNITYFLVRDGNSLTGWTEYLPSVKHNLGIVPVVPLLNKKRISETYGKTEIRESIKSAIDAACRLMMDLQATAELMAIPQRVLFGAKFEELMSQTNGSKWEAYIANVLAFEDPGGSIAQFMAAELRNFVDGMRQLEQNVANDTGLPPQYLSFSSDNPASADAILAAQDRLVKKSERKCRIFGDSWEQVMRLAILVMSPERKIPQEAYRMETVWANPATPTLAAKADAMVKLATAKTPDGRPVVPLEMVRILLGFTDVERKQMDQWDKQSATNVLSQLYGGIADTSTQTQPDPRIVQEDNEE